MFTNQTGLTSEPKHSIVDDFMYGSNVASSHVRIRLGFLRKVYGILSVQLGMTTIVATIIMFSGFSEYIKEKYNLSDLFF